MSTKDPIDLKQDRRQWLKNSATVLGASLLPIPAATAETAQVEGKPAVEVNATANKSAGRFFTLAQHALVEELSETIIPADSHSGGRNERALSRKNLYECVFGGANCVACGALGS